MERIQELYGFLVSSMRRLNVLKALKNKPLRPFEISKKIKLDGLDMMVKGLCKKLFSETYLYVEVHTYIKTLAESISNIKPNKHLIRYKNTYEEMIYGRQRSEAEAA